MRLVSRLAIITAVGAAAAVLGTTAAMSAAPTDVQPSLVEDYAYPGADTILKERGIELGSGDGHILLVDCTSPGPLVNVEGRGTTTTQNYCFKITGKTGYLTMKLPKIYLITSDDHALKAKLTAKGRETTVDISENSSKEVGEGVDQSNGPATLLEIRVKP